MDDGSRDRRDPREIEDATVESRLAAAREIEEIWDRLDRLDRWDRMDARSRDRRV